MNLFVFDIETIPDIAAGRKLYHLSDSLSDADILKIMQTKQGNQEFLPHYLHRIAAISVLLDTPTQLKIWSLGNPQDSEADIIQRFFQGIDKYIPTLVSWNGTGFDLPVLHYRALLQNIVAERYWQTGETDAQFRWNNYLNRYHYRHIDLLDILSAYQPRAFAPLESIATLLGLPGKMGMHGSQVWQYYQNGEIQRIRDYCETDVLNTYLVFLRFEHLRGHLNNADYQRRCVRLKELLCTSDKAHLQDFLHRWENPTCLSHDT